MTPGRPKIAAFLFDMDGVLVDSKEAWFESFREVGDISREQFEDHYWGRDLAKNLRPFDLSTGRFCATVYSRHLDRIKPVEEAKEVLKSIRGKKAIITNTTMDCTRQILKKYSLTRYFDRILTSDKVPAGKPDPAIIEKACRELGIKPAEAAVIGDSPEDMEAGRRAKTITIGLGTKGNFTINSLGELPALISRIQSRRHQNRADGKKVLNKEKSDEG